jgi:predicted phosphodiesterase
MPILRIFREISQRLAGIVIAMLARVQPKQGRLAMKRVLLAATALSLLLGAFAASGTRKLASGDVEVEVEARNPWTNLRVNAEPQTFHFAVVSDRTGGHRARVFSQAVEQLNLLQPAFVVSVGDLIEGYTKDAAKLAGEWKEFNAYVDKLQMPFFYVAGNHDVSNAEQTREWQERYGRRYYHFVYRDVLFLAVCSDDPAEVKKGPQLSQEQLDYFARVLKENPRPRWTVVLVHKPMWVFPNVDTNGWLDLEKVLKGRSYTVFAGHVHRFQKFVRQGQNYYQLATTGGGSKMRGLRYGEFDHLAWVTMKNDGPVLANLMLDGIYSEDMRRPVTDEEGSPIKNRKKVQVAQGKVVLDGKAVENALVALYAPDPKDAKKMRRVSDALTEPDGSFTLSTYHAGDGTPVGEYVVTVVQRDDPFDESGKVAPNRLPEVYASPMRSPLRVEVTEGRNVFDLNLSSR